MVCTCCAIEGLCQEGKDTESLIRQSTFIFVGTVTRLKATTVPEVRPSDSTAVVRVDQILEGADAPADLKGQDVTVQLTQPNSVKPGQQATFFTKGWLLGDSLAVIEVGHTERLSAEAFPNQLAASRQRVADDALRSDIASADAIVAGTVVAVRPANIRHIGSEHDPDWYEAEITAESVEKGTVPGHTVTVLFPNSEDVIWQSAPKFKQGQQGVWLLHRNQQKLPGMQERYTTLEPLDFQSRESLERIRSLRKAAR
jgi:hypothetical protein